MYVLQFWTSVVCLLLVSGGFEEAMTHSTAPPSIIQSSTSPPQTSDSATSTVAVLTAGELEASKEGPFSSQDLTTLKTQTTLSNEVMELRALGVSLVENNFTSSIECKVKVKAVINLQTSLEAACGLLDQGKAQWEIVFHCEMKDYDLLKEKLCSDMEIRLLRALAIQIVNSNFTSGQECKEKIVLVINAQKSQQHACESLNAGQGAWQTAFHCEMQDYFLLKDQLCPDMSSTVASTPGSTQSPEDYKLHHENIMCVINNDLSSEECTRTAQGQSDGEDDPERACSKLKTFQSILGQVHCTEEDYRKLYRVICDQELVPCSPIASLVKNLTPRCTATMSAMKNELLSPNACSRVESLKQQLLSSSVCTLSDYTKVQTFFCTANVTMSQAILAGERVDAVKELITVKLTDTCREVVWPEFQKINLSSLCVKVNTTGMSLVRQKVCSREDFDLLKAAVCVIHRDYSPQEQKLRDDLHVKIMTLSKTCQTTLLEQERQMQETTVEEACEKLTASHQALRTTETCSEEEISALSKMICSSACVFTVNRIVLIISLLTFIKLMYH